jgi:hypothetical protein
MRHMLDTVLAQLLASGKPVKHFGLTACQQPKHVQMLAYVTPLIPWGAP